MKKDKKNTGEGGREQLGSRLGFILLSAGCAIGIGNVWKFPYMTGENGGGLFVLLYMIFLAILGVPIMTMEFAMGRAAQKSPAKLYQELEPKGTKWHIHSYFAVAGNYLLMMFYTTVTAWMLQYFVKTAAGKFEGMNAEQVESTFNGMLADPLMMVIYVTIVIAIGFFVCSFSLQKGLEKVTKVMMLALLGIMVVLAIYSCCFTGKGALDGLKFYLIPNLEKINDVGIGNIIVSAMNQAFFTLSLGMGSMAIFGSYLKKDRALLGEAVNVAVLDTFVAVTSGLIIFPACFAYGVPTDKGASLIFITLPNLFNDLTVKGVFVGRIVGTLFFLFMSFAAMSTIFAVFENIVACTRDMFGWSRKKACLINGIAMLALSLPCVFGFNLLSFFEPLKAGNTIMDLEDFLVSNILLPLGSLVFVLFCVSRYGWGWKKFTEEANQGKGLKIAKWMRPYITYVLPLIIICLFIVGIVMYFK